jgi:hypothetical protein
MANKRVQSIERQPGGGVRVVLTDGSVANYRSTADLPDELLGLLGRMDSADGDEPQGDAEAARSAYQQRLEQAHQQGQIRANPGDGVPGLDGYRQRLESGWQMDLRKPKQPRSKHWQGA